MMWRLQTTAAPAYQTTHLGQQQQMQESMVHLTLVWGDSLADRSLPGTFLPQSSPPPSPQLPPPSIVLWSLHKHTALPFFLPLTGSQLRQRDGQCEWSRKVGGGEGKVEGEWLR